MHISNKNKIKPTISLTNDEASMGGKQIKLVLVKVRGVLSDLQLQSQFAFA